MTISVNALTEIEDHIKLLKQSFKETCAELREAKKQTDKFLRIAAKAGCKKVGICRRLDCERSWPFGSIAQVFGDGEGTAIWGPVHAMNIWGGCSNSGQAQIQPNAQLIEGVYELKGGAWSRVKD